MIKVVQWILDWKASTNATDKSANDVINMFCNLIAVFNHNLPKTWYLVQKLANPRNPKELMHSRCTCQQHWWGPLPPGKKKIKCVDRGHYVSRIEGESDEEYATRMVDIDVYTCPKCYAARYVTTKYDRCVDSGVPYYQWDIAGCVRMLFKQKEWAKYFNAGLEEQPYFSSPEYDRLQTALRVHAPHVDISRCVFVELGHDGFQPFNNTPHRSTWGVWLKVKNVDPRV